MNRKDLSGDAITPGTFSFGPVNNGVATVFVGCKGVDGGAPVLELRASVPAFPGNQVVPKQAEIAVGDQRRVGALDSFPAGQQIIFVVELTPAEISALSRSNSDNVGGISIGFRAAMRRGMISADLPSRNPAMDAVLGSCHIAPSVQTGAAVPGTPAVIPKGNPASTTGSSMSATAWSPRKAPEGRPSTTPDAGLLGTASVNVGTSPKYPAFLFVGCEDRDSRKIPVIRMTVPNSLKLDLSEVPTTPPTGNVAAAKRPVRTGEYGIWGNRAIYAAGKGQTYSMFQYDADPREVGELAATRPAGAQSFEFFIKDDMLMFSLPPTNGVLDGVLKACAVPAWSSDAPEGKILSPQFREAAVSTVQAIKAKRFAPGQQSDLAETTHLDDVAVTTAEFQVKAFIQSGLLPVSATEKAIPLRRTKCADDLIAAIKAGTADPSQPYKGPASCAYIEKEAPP